MIREVARRAARGAALAAAIAGLTPSARAAEPAADGWRPFKATWTLTGTRLVLPTEGARSAGIVHVTGPLTVTAGEGLGRGFLGELIAFDDGGALVVGRAVLTDERGDRIYSSLRAEPIEEGRKATGTVTGGTGRYTALEGTFTFSWQYVVSPESGEISGRIANIEGRTRRAPPSAPETPR